MDNKKQKRKSGTLVQVLQYIKKYHLQLLLSVILAVVSVVFTLYIPIVVGKAIDKMIAPGQVELEEISVLLIQVVGFSLLVAGSQWLMNTINNKVTFHVVQDIRNEAFEKIQSLPLKYIDGHSYGDIVSRMIADVDQFADGLLMGFTQLFTGVITILGTLGFMFYINGFIGLLVVILTPLSLFVARFIAKKTYHMFQKQSETRGKQTALIEEMIGNQQVVKAYCHEEEAMKSFDEINEQ